MDVYVILKTGLLSITKKDQALIFNQYLAISADELGF